MDIILQVQCNESIEGKHVPLQNRRHGRITLARHDQDNLDDHFRPFVNTHQFYYSFVIVEPFDYAELFNEFLRKQFLLLLCKR